MSVLIYLNDLGVVCVFGVGCVEVMLVLFVDVLGGFSDNDSLLLGCILVLGEVCMLLLVLDDLLVVLCGCNNVLLDVVLVQIVLVVVVVIVCYGVECVVVVLGISILGIGEFEQVLCSYVEQGQWLQGFDYVQQEMGIVVQFVCQCSGVQGLVWILFIVCLFSVKVLMLVVCMLCVGIVDVVIVGGVDLLCCFIVVGFSVLELVLV